VSGQTGPTLRTAVEPADLAAVAADMVARGGRFAGLAATADLDGGTRLFALLSGPRHVTVLESRLRPGQDAFPSVTALVPAAAWYEREVHDLFGVVPEGHPGLDPLVLPLEPGSPRPRPGHPGGPDRLVPHPAPLPVEVAGEGLFTIPYGPVRSGVFETIEYQVETFGEEIPSLRTRLHYKHRGLERRFRDLDLADAVLLAERVEGVASVAHAVAFCQAVEQLAGTDVPYGAQLLRVVHAELERLANHLDSMVRHCEGAGQAVALARLATHKERVMRLRAQLSGHRFGRGAVVPGGVSGPPSYPPEAALTALARLEGEVVSDIEALMRTPSFLDRLRNTGPVAPSTAAAHGAVGPVGRGSGTGNDARMDRPYGGYRSLGFEVAVSDEGDALARQQVRVVEVRQSFHLVRQALDEMAEEAPLGAGGVRRDDGERWRAPVGLADGLAVGSAEAPQGELLYLVEIEGGRLGAVKARTASFHNLALFPAAFQGDIFTDFAFIEASFGLSFAGVSG
jgi:Ni,Fe-hydrogenase III large subunit